MSILYSILIIFEAIVCFLLIGIVLIQKSTGDGNGLSFGSGAESVFGAQTGNILTRGTVVLAVLFLVNTLVLCILRPEARAHSLGEEIAADEAARAKAAATQDDAADILSNMDLGDVASTVEATAAGAADTAADAAKDAAAVVEEKADAAADAAKDAVKDAAAVVEEKATDAAAPAQP